MGAQHNFLASFLRKEGLVTRLLASLVALLGMIIVLQWIFRENPQVAANRQLVEEVQAARASKATEWVDENFPGMNQFLDDYIVIRGLQQSCEDDVISVIVSCSGGLDDAHVRADFNRTLDRLLGQLVALGQPEVACHLLSFLRQLGCLSDREVRAWAARFGLGDCAG